MESAPRLRRYMAGDVVRVGLLVTVVNVAVLVLKRDRVDHDHFSAPAFIPIAAIVVTVMLLVQQEADIFLRAAILLGFGLLLYVVNFAVKRILDHRNPEAR